MENAKDVKKKVKKIEPILVTLKNYSLLLIFHLESREKWKVAYEPAKSCRF